jgi:hypothetical protein
MVFLNKNKQAPVNRLERKGLGRNTIPAFILSLKSCLVDNPNMNYLQVNKRLHFLGWDDFDMDYHTLELAIANIEAEVF